MSQVVTIETQERGAFGSVMWWLFLAFNAFMAVSLLETLRKIIISAGTGPSPAEPFSSMMVVGFVLSLWLAGSLILGLIVGLSRGRKITVETTVASTRHT